MAHSSLARSVRAARVMEPGGGSASVWGACVRWASTSVQPEGCVASDLGAAINRPAAAHERFLGRRPAAAVHQAYRQPHKRCLCVVLPGWWGSGFGGDRPGCQRGRQLLVNYSADVPLFC